jgi:hypothetical protein
MSSEMNTIIMVASAAIFVVCVSFIIYDTQGNPLVSTAAIVTALSLAALIARGLIGRQECSGSAE